MYPDTCQTNCQDLQLQDLELKMEKQEEAGLSELHEETCSCNQCSFPSIKKDSFLWNMEKPGKFWKFQKLEELSANFSDLGSESFCESMIKAENICTSHVDCAGNIISREFVKSEQNVNATIWEPEIKTGKVIKKGSNYVARDSKTSFGLSEDQVNYPCNKNIIPTDDVCEVKNNMSVLAFNQTKSTDGLSCADEKKDEVAEKSRHFDTKFSTFIRPYKCLDCGARFSSKASIEVHIIKHIGQKLHKCQSISIEGSGRHLSQTFYPCDVCAKVYSSVKNLRGHKQIHTGEKPYKCDFCSKAFSDRSRLNLHRIIHTGDKRYKCGYCNAEFSQKGNLHRHERKHTGEKPYKCNFCGQAFYRKNQLKSHIRFHTGEKPYKCDYCNAEFSLKGNLHIHKRKHTGEKPYKCDYCNAKFSRQGSLHVHKRKHTGEKPYKCDYCNAEFSELCSLLRHKRKHTGEKPYKCDFCGQAFYQSGHLNSHKRVHTGEKPYRCDYCNAEFSHQGSLHRHRRTHM